MKHRVLSHLKQEIKCNASKTSEGNSKKSLKCDDECARLERNRKLALALNIDPEAHKDEHIPYSAETLRMFQEHVTWGQTQEREFRVFAADAAEKRLRFKPMPAKQRAFIHALADDFAFDSESMDPEPHRHVAVFKTPKFVTAPTKTLAECVRMRRHVESSSLAAADAQKKLRAGTAPYNGILLSHARFGLTLEELRAEFAATLTSTPTLAFDISFLPSEEIALKARAATASLAIPAPAIEAALKSLKPALLSLTSSKHLAASLQLCALDASLNILRREVDSAADGDGWSQVAAKAAAPRVAPRLGGVGERSVFTGEEEGDGGGGLGGGGGGEVGVGEVDGGEKGEGDAAEKGEGDAAEEGDGDGAEKREGDGAEKIKGDGTEIGAGGGDALGGLVGGAGGQEDGVVDDEKEELPVAEDRPASSGEEAEVGGTAHQ
ncbi:MAG: nf-x1-type zinc finger nfxl1 [Lasallia pustulata]|uniref:Nf-x1-type zinc finger nfxl1 n=1 Tax=Lasallia pustulata TaxID=136370 RepID=A0A5M8PJF4_9LECA|nr:MAG: nf-x1-type zinc finger nfxl1 [Lasallia pustulata]